MTQSEQKALVASSAIDTLVKEGLICNGTKIALGTGMTAIIAVRQLVSYIKGGKLSDIKACATSFQTSNLLQDLGVRVYSMNDKEIAGKLDIAIDGADEVDKENHLIKGGGAALLQEKIAAYNAKKYIIIVDSSKLKDTLGTAFPLPVEIVPAARSSVQNALSILGAKSTLREGVRKCGPVITDCGNFILDCLWETACDPVTMEDKIKSITGVVEVGFFCKNRPEVFFSTKEGKVERRR